MSTAPYVTTKLQGKVGILDITGDITDTAHDVVLSSYEKAVGRGAKKILLRFQSKSFINSAGIRVIMTVAFQAEQKKQPVRVLGLSPHMVEIFKLVGLTSYLTICDSEKSAFKGWF